MKKIQINENPYSWKISANELVVTQCRIDFAFEMIIWDSCDSYLSLRIACAFKFTEESDEYIIDPEADPKGMCPALSVFDQKIDSIEIFKTGLLVISFINKIKISIVPDPRYESWILSGDNGLIFNCLPGGEVASWIPK